MPRPDFDDRLTRPRSHRINDPARVMRTDEEVLPEAAFGSHKPAIIVGDGFVSGGDEDKYFIFHIPYSIFQIKFGIWNMEYGIWNRLQVRLRRLNLAP